MLDSTREDRRQEEFNNRGAQVRRRVDRRSVGWLCRRGGRRLRVCWPAGAGGRDAQGFVAEIEVVVCEAAALAGEDPVIWIPRLREGKLLVAYLGALTRKLGPCSMLLKMKYTP